MPQLRGLIACALAATGNLKSVTRSRHTAGVAASRRVCAQDIKAGFDLFEFADLFITVGASTAINLDGGGSSVTCLDGNVISRPTCVDTSKVCERQVTSITCIRHVPAATH